MGQGGGDNTDFSLHYFFINTYVKYIFKAHRGIALRPHCNQPCIVNIYKL